MRGNFPPSNNDVCLPWLLSPYFFYASRVQQNRGFWTLVCRKLFLRQLKDATDCRSFTGIPKLFSYMNNCACTICTLYTTTTLYIVPPTDLIIIVFCLLLRIFCILSFTQSRLSSLTLSATIYSSSYYGVSSPICRVFFLSS